jgi:hypothetical protein
MNMKRFYVFAVAVLCASAFSLNAQDKPAENQPKHRAGNPIVAALDANGDGEIDANEINNAPAALRKLDKNGDGKLTRDELRAARNGSSEGNRRKGKNK